MISTTNGEKSREEILAQRKLKKITKKMNRNKKDQEKLNEQKSCVRNSNVSEKYPMKLDTETVKASKTREDEMEILHLKKFNQHKIKLFSHLHESNQDGNLFINNSNIHPSMLQLGEQYAKRQINGSNARCIAFLDALKTMIEDFEILSNSKEAFIRSLEVNIRNSIDYLHTCRPLAVSTINAHKYFKMILTKLLALNHHRLISDIKENLIQSVDNFYRDQILKAAQSINIKIQEKICNDDVILIYGYSSLIFEILKNAVLNHGEKPHIICADSRPYYEGRKMLNYLISNGISCTYVLINGIDYIISDVTKILLGAHTIFLNGNVMSRCGTAQIALIANSYNKPVLICCETYKFCERIQTDAIVYNELSSPDDIVYVSSSSKTTEKINHLENWRSFSKLNPLNLNYDIVPSELITAIVTEIGILPCTSVPVVVRLREILHNSFKSNLKL